ncbi:MAG: type VI secretion system accessory protein TagJ [Rhodospirillaceae bacterium]
MDARDHFKNGNLTAAVAAMIQEVKQHPTDSGARTFLAELLCFTGDFERAAKHLELVADQDAARSIPIAQFRQLLRAEIARHQTFDEGRVPHFLAPPPPHIEKALRALASLRAGNEPEAAELLAEAEALCPALAGQCDGKPFDDFRDADDITAGLIEVLTITGHYHWVPLTEILEITFQPPQRPRDLLWRRARLSIRSGPDGEVFIPVLYPTLPPESPDQVRLGHATRWTDQPGSPVRGIGQRLFLAGDQDLAITEISALVFREGV